MDHPKWKDTFHFIQSERRGVFVLASFLFLLLIINALLDRFYTPTKTNFAPFKKAIAAFEAERKLAVKETILQPFLFNPNTASKKELVNLGLDNILSERIINYRKKGGRFIEKEDLQKIYGLGKKDYKRLSPFIRITKRSPNIKKESKPAYQLHPFNPNTVSRDALLSMGVSPKAVQQWLNYRSKGGRFKQKEEVRKIYALTNNEYQRLSPYMKMPATISNSNKRVATVTMANKFSQYDAISDVKLDVNTATNQDWQRLKGIGPAYAKRIINFRSKLGGFVDLNQIRNTYRLPDSVFQKIKPQLLLSPIAPPLGINMATLETLTAHPYIQKRQAKAIVNYRKNHGKFGRWEDFKKVVVFSDQELIRLKPYLDFR